MKISAAKSELSTLAIKVLQISQTSAIFLKRTQELHRQSLERTTSALEHRLDDTWLS